MLHWGFRSILLGKNKQEFHQRRGRKLRLFHRLIECCYKDLNGFEIEINNIEKFQTISNYKNECTI